MENYEEDFVTADSAEFEIDGRKFSYKPATADDELNWTNECIEIVDGVPKQNYKKITQCKIRNVISVPYGKETINKIIKLDKEWSGLNNKEKLNFFGKLSPGMFDKIIKKINQIDSPSEKKN